MMIRKSVAISMLVCFTPFIGSTIADDSDIYLGSGAAASGPSGTLNPNIMLVIDTSGSMTNKDGQTKTRLERVKESLTNIINNTNNVNMGLMRFHKNGGPVLYPVSDIDGIAASNDNTVVVSISNDSDDAEEGKISGAVIATTGAEAGQLELINAPTAGFTPDAGSIPTGLSSGLYINTTNVNDAFESSGTVDCGSADYYLKGDSTHYIRTNFLSAAIPANAKIIHAELAFTAAANESGDMDVTIKGESTANAASMLCPTAPNAISSLTSTTAFVNWNNVVHPPSAPAAPNADRLVSPNLATIIQEIVGTDSSPTSWVSGNNLALILNGNGGAGQRKLYSENNGGALDVYGNNARPLLKVIFSSGTTVTEITAQVNSNNDDGEQRPGDTPNNYVNSSDIELVTENGTRDQRVGIRFQNINVPQGANIHYADLVFEVDVERGTGDVSVEITAEDADDTTDDFSAGKPLISNRARVQDNTGSVNLVIPWKYLAAPNINDQLYSSDISALVQQIVNRGTITGPAGNWTANNSMTFFLEEGGFSNGSQWRELESHNGEAAAAPKLRIWYSEPATLPGQDQYVGMRFQNVSLPAGVTITSANLEFRASGSSSAPTWMNIYPELPTDGDADPYSEVTNDITGRNYSSSYVNWSGPDTLDETDSIDPWVVGNTHQSPDISALVQEAVNNTNWCGGNALAFKIEGDGRQIAWSHDGDATAAPVLRVEYDDSGLTTATTDGCIAETVSYQIATGNSDAEESKSNGVVNLTSSDLELGKDGGTQQIVGLYFGDVQIPKDADVLEATIAFYPDDDGVSNGGTPSYIFTAQDPTSYVSDNTFSTTTNDLSGRTTTGDSATWSNVPAFTTNGPAQEFSSTAFKTLIENVVKDVDWAQGSPLILFVDGVATDLGERETESANENAGRAPELTIKYRGYLSGGTTQKTVRQHLLEVVDQLDHKSGTPFVDTYYEAAKYYEGDQVYYGLSRGGGPTLSASEISGASSNSGELQNSERTRLSHTDSYTGTAIIDRSKDIDGNSVADCTPQNPTHVDCRTELITTTHDYVSPIADSCQANYIVMLSDGQANNNHSSGLIPTDKTLGGSCNATITQTSDTTERSAGSGEACGVDLAKYLYNADGDTSGAVNSIFTHTIGLSLSSNAGAVDFLKEVAEQGNGQYFDADDQNSIDVAFDTIVKDAIQSNSSFVTPGLSVNAFNRLFSRNFVYFNLFHTDSDATWDGNIKKFALCDSEDPDVCAFGEVIDSNGDLAVDIDPTSADFGNLKDTAVGFWSTAGTSEITQQGAGSRVLDYTSRVVYAGESQAGTSLHLISNTDDASGANPSSTYRTMLHDGSLPNGAVFCDDGSGGINDACMDDLVGYQLGKRTNTAKQEEGIDANNRWAYTDGIHVRPLVMTYGGDDADPISRLFVGSNDGSLRAINDGNSDGYNPTTNNVGGEEEWVLYPWQTLDRQMDLQNNISAAAHIYGLDSTPTARVKDVDKDNTIEPVDGDFVHLYMGMRRSTGYKGRSIFSFDVSPDRAAGMADQKSGNTNYTNSNSSNTITPTINWIVDAEDTSNLDDFSQLGETWSVPTPILVQYDSSTRKTVVAFGGGYDPTSEDGGKWGGTLTNNDPTVTTTDTMGNAIYVVDADTGDLLWWASSDSAADKVVPDMKYSIASALTMLDTDADGITDRMYAVDVAAQVWRIDLKTDGTDLSDTRVAKLAQLGVVSPLANRRKFFYTAEVAQVTDTNFTETGNQDYDMVAVLSGDRADPLEEDVTNRVYLLRDYLTGGLIATDGSNYPVCSNGSTCSTLTESNLLDITTINFADPGERATNLVDLQESEGWYITFAGSGEKGFSEVTILDGIMFFTTFLPSSSTSPTLSCDPALGSSNLYGISAFTGEPVFPTWGGDTTAYELGDRTYGLGSGPSARVVPAYLKPGVTLIVPTGAGAIAQDPNIQNRLTKTFWYQQ